MRMEDYEAAVPPLRQAVELDGKRRNKLARNNLGYSYYALKQYAKAVEYPRDAVDIDPNFALAHVNLGLALSDAGEFDLAAKHLERAVALGSSSSAVYNRLGYSLAQAGRFLQAIEPLLKAVQAQDDNVSTLVNLGWRPQLRSLHRCCGPTQVAQVCLRPSGDGTDARKAR